MSELVALIRAHRKPLIGMIQIGALPGGSRYRGARLSALLDRALGEAELLATAGFDALMVQNLGDLPVARRVEPLQIAWMTRIAGAIRSRFGLPTGLNLLENDAAAMLAVASAAELDFVRIKVFVGAMLTATGIEAGQAHAAIRTRNACNGDAIAIFADVHDRTAVPLATARFADDLHAALRLGGADGVVLTGRSHDETLGFLVTARAAIADRPMLVGGGVSASTVGAILQRADGAIVSSALKTGDSLFGDLDARKVREFIAAADAARARARS